MVWAVSENGLLFPVVGSRKSAQAAGEGGGRSQQEMAVGRFVPD